MRNGAAAFDIAFMDGFLVLCKDRRVGDPDALQAPCVHTGVNTVVSASQPGALFSGPEYSVAIDAASGLDPSTDPALPPQSLNTLRITSMSSVGAYCLDPAMVVVVAYQSLVLASTTPRPRVCARGWGRAAQVSVIASSGSWSDLDWSAFAGFRAGRPRDGHAARGCGVRRRADDPAEGQRLSAASALVQSSAGWGCPRLGNSVPHDYGNRSKLGRSTASTSPVRLQS
uniref:Uncharacterized protein n=1 Tax=Leersia perrieri TaxID=77586 RepID=A0A0D9VIE0_9ORYZ